MRPALTAAAAALLLLALAGCAPQRAARAEHSSHLSPIVVQEFTFSPGVVTLDPSFGFSLHHGAPGVPPRQRAESVGRAVAFNLADAITRYLKGLGYDAIHVARNSPEPAGRALIVSGAFRHIYEGHRRRNASVQVATGVTYNAPGAAPQRLTTFDLDSRRLPREQPMSTADRRDGGVNYEARRVGVAIGRYLARLARLNRWRTAAR